ncbi:MAG: FAD-dependent oxidoreductase [Acidimicrobiia bacterium]
MTGPSIGGRATEADHDADVLVVGSGAGGAVTAALLAEAGIDVLVVEEGPWIEQGVLAPFSLEQMDRQYRAGGITVALGRPSIAYTEGRCAGGGTEVNSGLYRRPPPEILERWRRDFEIGDFDPDDLYAIGAELEAALSVSTSPGGLTAAGDVLRRGADALGWANSEIPRWMVYPDPAAPESGQRQSMTRTFLPRAARAGARILTECRVDRLERQGGRARSATVTLADGRTGSIRFRDVIVCGGAIQTPALLQRSGIGGVIGKTLAVHPTVKLAARFREPINVPNDVPVHQVKEFAPDLSFGCSASGPGLVALALSDNWTDFARAMPEWRDIAVYYAAITSEGRGRVRAVPGWREPVVTYRLTARDRELLRSGLARLALVMLEAGAIEVYPSVRDAPLVRNRRDLAELQRTFRATRASVMTVHLCSTVPMGEREGACGADSHGRVHGTDNVYVNDASLLPDAPGVNPQGTVMAFAVRNARHYLARRTTHA